MTDLPPASTPPTPEADHSRQREPIFRIPPVTGWLIALNVLVQLVREFLTPQQDEAVFMTLGFSAGAAHTGAMTLVTLVTFQFLHGGWEHLGLNMISLLAFGAGIEQMLGRARFLALYLLSGVAGALLEAVFTTPGSDDLLVGASAGISGVFGALLIIRSLHLGRQRGGNGARGIFTMALLWIGLMAVTGIFGMGSQGAPVAWIAHIGGFLAGMALGPALTPARRGV